MIPTVASAAFHLDDCRYHCCCSAPTRLRGLSMRMNNSVVKEPYTLNRLSIWISGRKTIKIAIFLASLRQFFNYTNTTRTSNLPKQQFLRTNTSSHSQETNQSICISSTSSPLSLLSPPPSVLLPLQSRLQPPTQPPLLSPMLSPMQPPLLPILTNVCIFIYSPSIHLPSSHTFDFVLHRIQIRDGIFLT